MFDNNNIANFITSRVVFKLGLNIIVKDKSYFISMLNSSNITSRVKVKTIFIVIRIYKRQETIAFNIIYISNYKVILSML